MGRISPCARLLPRILALIARNYTRKQIAERLHLSVHSLVAFLQRRKIPGRPRTAADKVDEIRLRKMIEAGRTHPRIAKALGVSRSAIERRAAKLGLQSARTGPRSGRDHPEWKTGRTLDKHAYVRVWAPLHPRARKGGHVLEHVLVAEVAAGRYLDRREVVSHKDDHPFHNWPSNLEVFASNADHLRAELAHRVKATRRASIPGGYKSNRKTGRCPSEDETLARCSSKIRVRLAWYIESHRPTNEHRTLSRREFLRTGAWRDPFRPESTA